MLENVYTGNEVLSQALGVVRHSAKSVTHATHNHPTTLLSQQASLSMIVRSQKSMNVVNSYLLMSRLGLTTEWEWDCAIPKGSSELRSEPCWPQLNVPGCSWYLRSLVRGRNFEKACPLLLPRHKGCPLWGDKKMEYPSAISTSCRLQSEAI